MGIKYGQYEAARRLLLTTDCAFAQIGTVVGISDATVAVIAKAEHNFDRLRRENGETVEAIAVRPRGWCSPPPTLDDVFDDDEEHKPKLQAGPDKLPDFGSLPTLCREHMCKMPCLMCHLRELKERSRAEQMEPRRGPRRPLR